MNFFFFNDTATTEIYTLSLHDALPIFKDTEPEQLIHAVRMLAAGRSVLSPAVTRTVISGYLEGSARPADVGRIEAMSQREREVLGLIGQGLSNAEIGRRLHLSTATVKEIGRASCRERV